MTNSFKCLPKLASIGAAVLVFPLTAQAADLDPPSEPVAAKDVLGIYASVFGGANFLQDSDFTNGITNVAVDFNTGFNVGGAIGYKWNNLNLGFVTPRTELEFSYFDNGVGGINFSGNGPAAEAVISGSDVSAFTLFTNLYFDYDNDSRITPYVGGGIGVAFTDLNIAYNAANLNLSDSDTNFAWHVGAGASIDVTDSLSFFADARYQQIVNASSVRNIGAVPVPAGGGAGIFEDDLSSVLVRAGLTYSF